MIPQRWIESYLRFLLTYRWSVALVVGQAIIFTASTMVAATIFFWFSDLKFLAEMGLLLAVLMVFNTFGGLVVVPAFVKVIRPAFLLNRATHTATPERRAVAS